eukprot:TRINITY_DN25529_c0_g1_i1.p1 TRINITY_DN25529_c0_g1~~TRINITY_DN25529_c0_g1_i1.p1  ORF type:complete len:496 (+),score=96.09 TRINITY_DN25529_c0_g1_i1:120-1607(+)
MVSDTGQVLGIWEKILREAVSATKVPDGTVLVLGRANIGKRTLVSALLGHAHPPSAAALAAEDADPEGHSRAVAMDYAYFGVRDTELPHSEVISADFVCPATCSVLVMEDTAHEKLVFGRMQTFDMRYCAAMICLDMKEPWHMMDDLRRWIDALQRLTSECMVALPVEKQDALRKRVEDAVAVGAVADTGLNKEAGADGDVAATAEGKVACNFGFPLVVVVTRADSASTLESQKTVGWSDTIQAYLRKTCISYGAALVYTSVQPKNTRNIDVLYDYLMHRMYDFSFKRHADEKSLDALFLPSGWDSEDKIDQASLERSFESVVMPQITQATSDAKAEECEDMATFLKRMQQQLMKLGGVSVATTGRPREGTVDGKRLAKMDLSGRKVSNVDPSSAAIPGVTGVCSGVSGAGGAAGPPGTDTSSLASFFQNLLTRQAAGAPKTPGTPANPASGPGASGNVTPTTVPPPGGAPVATPATPPVAVPAPAPAPDPPAQA